LGFGGHWKLEPLLMLRLTATVIPTMGMLARTMLVGR
jgi:hypothetical protein